MLDTFSGLSPQTLDNASVMKITCSFLRRRFCWWLCKRLMSYDEFIRNRKDYRKFIEMIFCFTNCVDNLIVHKISSVAELFSNGFVCVAGSRHLSLDLQCLSSLKRLYHYMYRQTFSRITSILLQKSF